MGGTLLNVATVFIGSLIGLLVGNRLPERTRESITMALGMVTLAVGVSNAQLSGNVVIVLLATVLGVLIGEALRLDLALEQLADALRARLGAGGGDGARERFINGFVTASLVFCVGPLTFVGSIQDGMGLAVGFQSLAIKSVLDGFASIAFASTFGIGVMATLITVLVVQGGLALVGMALVSALSDPASTQTLSSAPAIVELTAVGGILLIGLSLTLMGVARPRVANFLPALAVAPLLVWGATALGVNIYPL
jgi:uncharacterized membrane protein YqgA involved in biofilm formation